MRSQAFAGAVFGLILLLLSWLILFVINPDILNLNALKSSLAGGATFTGASPTNPTQVTYTPGQLPNPIVNDTSLTQTPTVNWSTAP